MVLPLGDSERTAITPLATYGLIAMNVVMFLLQLGRGPEFTTAYAATPFEITERVDLPNMPQLEERGIPQRTIAVPVWLTLLTSLFLHGSPLHLAGNMLYLWIFGDNVEEVLGRTRYILAYLACGVVGTLIQVLANQHSLIPTLGASGAVAGVMGMYLVWFPDHRIRVLLIRVIIEIPAVWVIGSWIAIQVFRGFSSLGDLGSVGGVAYLAHIGGAGLGVLIGLLSRDRARRRHKSGRPWYDRRDWQRWDDHQH